MKREILFLWMIVLFALPFVSGCKKYKQEFLGPEYVEASPNFALATSTFEVWRKNKVSGFESMLTGTTNFSSNSQYYKLGFNERVSWQIAITGLENGAQRIIKGTSDSIGYSNSLWDGGASNGLFFNTGDSLDITISFAGTDISLSRRMKINGVKSYNGIDAATGVKYFTVDDFEGGYTAENTGLSAFYVDPADEGNFGNNGFTGDKVQGNFSYRMYGKDANSNTYLGGSDTPTLNDFEAGTFTTTNPDSLYVNMYVKGFGKPNTALAIMVRENDANQAVGVHNLKDANGVDILINDRWIYFLSIDWVGWKLVSVPYSSFKRPSTGGGFGDNLLTPNKFCGLSLELDSYPTGGSEVELLVDMVVITQGGVFKQ